MAKGKHALKGLKGGPAAKQGGPGDPVKGLKDAIKAKEIQGLAMEAALQSGGAGGGGMK